jgi:hypothetical protein
MWRSLAKAGITFALLLLSAAAASAEPIAVTYRIDVFKLCQYAGTTQTCADYHSSFPLTLSFDSQITLEHGDDLDRTRFYGAPFVSDVPLPLRRDFPPLDLTLRQAAERARFSAGVWLRESSVLIRYGVSHGGSDYYRDFSLIANDAYDSVPDLNAETFAQFLGTAAFRQFAIADSVELASGGFEQLAYYGHVSLNTTVTPEPASMTLLGTGLLILVRRLSHRDGGEIVG